MNTFESNVVTHFPSKSMGTLFKNPLDSTDPNIYVLFSGHVCRTDCINATFLTFKNTTVNAKILNVNIWIDVACAVIQDPTQIDFPIITKFVQDPVFAENQSVNYFSNYMINNSLVLLITSQVRDPSYRYPQNIHHFLYPESVLLEEGQGVMGVSGSPMVDQDYNITGMVSKIIGPKNTANMPNMPNNLVITKSSMFYLYLFDPVNGLIQQFYTFYKKYPTVNDNFNLLVSFRNSFNIIINHLGFLYRSYKDMTSSATVNLSPDINGIVLSFRITGLNKVSYMLTNFLQNNDPDVETFTTLLDNTTIMSDFYINKAFILIKSITYTDRLGKSITIDLGVNGITSYYVNGDPSQPITIVYTINQPSGPGGVNMAFGPFTSITITPKLVTDSDGTVRYSSQLPKSFTSTSSRANGIMMMNLFNQTTQMTNYNLNYS